jgi:DNA-binding MarR family transcriptional regulator
MTDHPQLIQAIRQNMDLLIHRAFRGQGHFVKSAGLSMAQFGILMQLHYQHQCGLSDISSRMEISSAAASQLVDKLVQSELIERTEDPQDRRAKKLKLTAKGQNLIDAGIQARSNWMDELIATLTPEESATVVKGFAILAEAARRIETPAKNNH